MMDHLVIAAAAVTIGMGADLTVTAENGTAYLVGDVTCFTADDDGDYWTPAGDREVTTSVSVALGPVALLEAECAECADDDDVTQWASIVIGDALARAEALQAI